MDQGSKFLPIAIRQLLATNSSLYFGSRRRINSFYDVSRSENDSFPQLSHLAIAQFSNNPDTRLLKIPSLSQFAVLLL